MVYLPAVFVIFTTCFMSLLLYFKRAFSYWKNKNVPYVEPSIPFGSLGNPFWDKKGVMMRLKEAYDELKVKGADFGGLYIGFKPILMVISPKMTKTILHLAFDHFEGNGNVFDEESEPLGAHLLNLHGNRWKEMRVKLTPSFTSGKMKMMFQTILNCGMQLEDHIKVSCREKDWIDVKEVMACFTTDVITSCAFGLECNSLKNPETEFRLYGKKAFETNLKTTLRRFGNIACPGIVKAFKLSLFDRSSTDFFMRAIVRIVDYRKTNKVTRNDFVQILLDMEGAGFTAEEIAAQAFIFFLAGFETSSTTMTFCLYELAYHQEVQERVREEINFVIKRYGEELTYEGIMEMKYLDQVVNETLRKHPPLPALKRICTKDYQLTNGVVIRKGDIVFLSVLGLHTDDEYFPNPSEFDPERFSDENKARIPSCGFIPFGEGPRMCIGRRFGTLQTKVGLCTILKNHKISPNELLEYPIEYDSKNFMLNAKGPVLLNFDSIKKQ